MPTVCPLCAKSINSIIKFVSRQPCWGNNQCVHVINTCRACIGGLINTAGCCACGEPIVEKAPTLMSYGHTVDESDDVAVFCDRKCLLYFGKTQHILTNLRPCICMRIVGDYEKDPEATEPMSVCEWCAKRENLQMCSRCKKVQYCSEECQKRHWEAHKHDCA